MVTLSSITPTVVRFSEGCQSYFLEAGMPGLNTIEQLAQTTPQISSDTPVLYDPIASTCNTCVRLLAFNHSGHVVGIACGQWKCPNCSRRLARLWAWRVRLHILARPGIQARFWTLTMRPKYHDPEEAYADLPKLWNTLRMIMKRELGKWEYVAFVEGQRQRLGMPHFHIISMARSPRRIKDLAMQAGFGYQATETPVSGPTAANYCAKYASKHSDRVPIHFRRVRCSQSWAKLPPYAGMPLLVKSRGEFTSHFIYRVHDATGIEMETLLARWNVAIEDLAEK